MKHKLAVAFFLGALVGIALMYIYGAAYDYVYLAYTEPPRQSAPAPPMELPVWTY